MWTHTPYVLRKIRLCPYLYGSKGPIFSLNIWDTKKTTEYTTIGYRLRTKDEIIFEGDFPGLSLYASNSDKTLAFLLSRLTLEPKDSDAIFFTSYTNSQKEFCKRHALNLSIIAHQRFGKTDVMIKNESLIKAHHQTASAIRKLTLIIDELTDKVKQLEFALKEIEKNVHRINKVINIYSP